MNPGEQTPDSNTPPANPDGNTPPAPAPVEPDTSKTPATPAPAPQDKTAKLQSERDKANHRVDVLEAFLEPIAVERAVDAFLKDNAEKFPDLKKEDLLDASDISTEALEKYATRLQTRLQEHAQNKILEIENPSVAKMSPEDRAAELEKLRTSKEPGAFQKYLAIISAA